jgi:aminoacylase
VFYGERLPWWIKVTAVGNTGHASRFIESTAVEQILGVAQRALEFRTEQRKILHGETDCDHSGCSHSVATKKVLGDVTTLNLTVLSTGLPGESTTKAYNVVPAVAEAVFDIRISPHMDPKEMSEKLNLWCKECSATGKSAGESSVELGLKWTYVTNSMQQHQTTSTDPVVNPWWTVFENSVAAFDGAAVTPLVFPAATDSRFLRAIGVRALGFSPIRNSPILLHEHNEYLEESVFLEGCRVYVTLLGSLASQPHFTGDEN